MTVAANDNGEWTWMSLGVVVRGMLAGDAARRAEKDRPQRATDPTGEPAAVEGGNARDGQMHPEVRRTGRAARIR